MIMELPSDVAQLLNGQDLEQKQHIVMTLHSITSEGYPHTSMLSVGEIIAINSKHLRLALWPRTTTTLSLESLKKANLVIVYNQKVCYLELDTIVLPKPEVEQYERVRFEAIIQTIKIDSAKYAEIKSGITVNMYNPNDVIERWKVTLNELLNV